jgi:hypothetical protein
MTPATPTIGQDIDKELAALKARVAVIETDASTSWAAVKTWVKSNGAHFVTWAGVGAVAVKTGVVTDLVKLL